MIGEVEGLCRKLNIPYDAETDEKFAGYMEGILSWNEHINLTAITDRTEFVQKHYIDSLLCANAPEVLGASRVIDVGTGGGFPGVPLAIVFPDKEFVLVDSLRKRLRVIEELCEKLGIGNVRVVHGRAEELARLGELRESFDLCVSRAVANMSTLAEYCLPFVRVGGSLLAYKGPDCEDEVGRAGRAIKLLGGRLDRIEEARSDAPAAADLRSGSPAARESAAAAGTVPCDPHSDREAAPEPLRHKLIFISKTSPTLSKYPRKAGTPAKEPL